MLLHIGILTISDRSALGERPDLSGPALLHVVESHRWHVALQAIVPDDLAEIAATLERWADSGKVDLILTTGGTGLSPRDVTPDATLAAVDRQVPGISEAMRSASLQATPHAMLSRAVAGIRKRTLIVNLPGSPKGALENFQVILPVLEHAVQLVKGDPDAEAGHEYSFEKK